MSDDQYRKVMDVATSQKETSAELAEKLDAVLDILAKQGDVILHLQTQVIGLTTAVQFFAEIVMASAPNVKSAIEIATSQLLSHPELIPNLALQDSLRALHKVSSSPSPTAEGRRAGFHAISSDDGAGEP
jgi:hypothetical protein